MAVLERTTENNVLLRDLIMQTICSIPTTHNPLLSPRKPFRFYNSLANLNEYLGRFLNVPSLGSIQGCVLIP